MFGAKISSIIQPYILIRTIQLQDVVVTASRLHENINKSPVSIEKVTQSAVQRSAAPSFFDALENTKGVQMITSSLGFKVTEMNFVVGSLLFW